MIKPIHIRNVSDQTSGRYKYMADHFSVMPFDTGAFRIEPVSWLFTSKKELLEWLDKELPED